MESTRAQEPLDGPLILREVALDHGVTSAVPQFAINATDAETKDVAYQRQDSPTRTPSLLPPFGVSQPSHLPTPQSPGNLAGYLNGSAESPLSADHLRAGPSRQFTNSRPPPRPLSAHPPKTPQHEPSTPKPKILSRTLPPPFRTDMLDNGRVMDPSRPHPSQIATPSPEISRTHRASVPNSPSDNETIATPSAKQSSTHSHTGNTTLAPAPIISPANSSYPTIYHASPEFYSGRHDTPSYTVSHNIATLVAERNLQNDSQTHIPYLDDPFIVASGAGRKDGSSRERYLSPPISRNRHHCSTHGRTSPASRSRAAEGGISRLAMSPSESSEAPSFGTPVKAEVEDIEYHVTTHPVVPDGAAPPRVLASPRTPPPPGPARSLEATFRKSPLDQSTFHTPLRAPGGEMERIRQRQADLTDARMAQSEKRRPEYLVRAKRLRDDPDEAEAQQERENALPGLGVTVSPAKGRRLKLYRPVPIAGGAVLTADPPPGTETAEPKTPPPLSTASFASFPAMSMRAISWRTPSQARTSPVVWTEEDERKKQKRLAAFKAPEPSKSVQRLKPVDVPGQGRMVIDVTSEESQALEDAGILEIPRHYHKTLDDAEVLGHSAGWPDNEYPWSLQKQQRELEKEAERYTRLHWIERFLDRESESDEDDHEVVAGPSTQSLPLDIDNPSRPQRGRGKSVSLKATPGLRRSATTDRRVFRAANSDAREVLLSKKHVREVAERMRRRKLAEEEEGVVMCICQGADDGRPMVRCDECRTWYHLVCMDITDESELGDEWFCWKCTPSTEDPPPAPVFEPTFAPMMPDSPPRTSVGDLPLYQTALQPSPMLDIRTRAPVSPSIPMHFSRDRDHERSPPRRSRLPHLMSEPDDPVRGGPSTPYHAHSSDTRIYSTPKFDDYAEEYIPFDPTSTPSRGLKFPNPVPVTPRRPLPTWAGQNLLWATPSAPPRTPKFSSQTPSSSARSLAYSLSTMEDSGGPFTSPWPGDGSPVRRPHKPNESGYPYTLPRRPLDSPLAVRGSNRLFQSGVEESPTARYMPRGKDRDSGGTSTRTAHGQSPRRE